MDALHFRELPFSLFMFVALQVLSSLGYSLLSGTTFGRQKDLKVDINYICLNTRLNRYSLNIWLLPEILLAYLGLLNTHWGEAEELTTTSGDKCAEAPYRVSRERLAPKLGSLQTLLSLLTAKILRETSFDILTWMFLDVSSELFHNPYKMRLGTQTWSIPHPISCWLIWAWDQN